VERDHSGLLVDADKRVTMFSGKGGVGKTTCAGATALHFAQQGERTLVLSTDPTPSLSDIFEVTSKEKPAKVTENLYLVELGMNEVKEKWDKKFGRDVYEVFSAVVSIEYPEFVDFITSILPGLREEFMVDYIKELTRSGTYERVVWDTAPLGQTMDLLHTPGLIREHLKPAPRIYSRLRLGRRRRRPIMDIIKRWEKLSNEDIDFLRTEVDYVMVTIPEALAAQQLEGVFKEAEEQDFRFKHLVVNNVITKADSTFLEAKRAQQQGYLTSLHEKYESMGIVELPLFPHEIKGEDKLELIGKSLFNTRETL